MSCVCRCVDQLLTFPVLFTRCPKILRRCARTSTSALLATSTSRPPSSSCPPTRAPRASAAAAWGSTTRHAFARTTATTAGCSNHCDARKSPTRMAPGLPSSCRYRHWKFSAAIWKLYMLRMFFVSLVMYSREMKRKRAFCQFCCCCCCFYSVDFWLDWWNQLLGTQACAVLKNTEHCLGACVRVGWM